jgi:hypothetical protein
MKTFISLLTLLATLAASAKEPVVVLSTGEPHAYAVFKDNKTDSVVIDAKKGGAGLVMYNELDKRKSQVALGFIGISLVPDLFYSAYTFAPPDKYKVIAKLMCIDIIIATSDKSSIRSMQEVIEMERKGKTVFLGGFQSPFLTGITHLLNDQYGTKLERVPYTDIAQNKIDAASGVIDLVVADASLFGAEFKTGHLRPVLNLGNNKYHGIPNLNASPVVSCYYAVAHKDYDAAKEIEMFKRTRDAILAASEENALTYWDKVFLFESEELNRDVAQTRKHYQTLMAKYKIQKQ